MLSINRAHYLKKEREMEGVPSSTTAPPPPPLVPGFISPPISPRADAAAAPAAVEEDQEAAAAVVLPTVQSVSFFDVRTEQTVSVLVELATGKHLHQFGEARWHAHPPAKQQQRQDQLDASGPLDISTILLRRWQNPETINRFPLYMFLRTLVTSNGGVSEPVKRYASLLIDKCHLIAHVMSVTDCHVNYDQRDMQRRWKDAGYDAEKTLTKDTTTNEYLRYIVTRNKDELIALARLISSFVTRNVRSSIKMGSHFGRRQERSTGNSRISLSSDPSLTDMHYDALADFSRDTNWYEENDQLNVSMDGQGREVIKSRNRLAYGVRWVVGEGESLPASGKPRTFDKTKLPIERQLPEMAFARKVLVARARYDLDPAYRGKRDPITMSGIIMTVETGDRAYYACCGQALDHPGCLIDVYSSKSQYPVPASIGNFKPYAVTGVDVVTPAILGDLWARSYVRGTAYLNEAYYLELHTAIQSLIPYCSSDVGRGFAAMLERPINPSAFFQTVGPQGLNYLVAVYALIREYNDYRSDQRPSVPTTPFEWIRFMEENVVKAWTLYGGGENDPDYPGRIQRDSLRSAVLDRVIPGVIDNKDAQRRGLVSAGIPQSIGNVFTPDVLAAIDRVPLFIRLRRAENAPMDLPPVVPQEEGDADAVILPAVAPPPPAAVDQPPPPPPPLREATPPLPDTPPPGTVVQTPPPPSPQPFESTLSLEDRELLSTVRAAVALDFPKRSDDPRRSITGSPESVAYTLLLGRYMRDGDTLITRLNILQNKLPRSGADDLYDEIINLRNGLIDRSRLAETELRLAAEARRKEIEDEQRRADAAAGLLTPAQNAPPASSPPPLVPPPETTTGISLLSEREADVVAATLNPLVYVGYDPAMDAIEAAALRIQLYDDQVLLDRAYRRLEQNNPVDAARVREALDIIDADINAIDSVMFPTSPPGRDTTAIPFPGFSDDEGEEAIPGNANDNNNISIFDDSFDANAQGNDEVVQVDAGQPVVAALAGNALMANGVMSAEGRTLLETCRQILGTANESDKVLLPPHDGVPGGGLLWKKEKSKKRFDFTYVNDHIVTVIAGALLALDRESIRNADFGDIQLSGDAAMLPGLSPVQYAMLFDGAAYPGYGGVAQGEEDMPKEFIPNLASQARIAQDAIAEEGVPQPVRPRYLTTHWNGSGIKVKREKSSLRFLIYDNNPIRAADIKRSCVIWANFLTVLLEVTKPQYADAADAAEIYNRLMAPPLIDGSPEKRALDAINDIREATRSDPKKSLFLPSYIVSIKDPIYESLHKVKFIQTQMTPPVMMYDDLMGDGTKTAEGDRELANYQEMCRLSGHPEAAVMSHLAGIGVAVSRSARLPPKLSEVAKTLKQVETRSQYALMGELKKGQVSSEAEELFLETDGGVNGNLVRPFLEAIRTLIDQEGGGSIEAFGEKVICLDVLRSLKLIKTVISSDPDNASAGIRSREVLITGVSSSSGGTTLNMGDMPLLDQINLLHRWGDLAAFLDKRIQGIKDDDETDTLEKIKAAWKGLDRIECGPSAQPKPQQHPAPVSSGKTKGVGATLADAARTMFDWA